MENIGKIVVAAGLVLVVVGGVLILGERLGIRFGSLPLDIQVRRDNFSFYFPLGTSILISLVLTLLYLLFNRIR